MPSPPIGHQWLNKVTIPSEQDEFIGVTYRVWGIGYLQGHVWPPKSYLNVVVISLKLHKWPASSPSTPPPLQWTSQTLYSISRNHRHLGQKCTQLGREPSRKWLNLRWDTALPWRPWRECHLTGAWWLLVSAALVKIVKSRIPRAVRDTALFL